MSRTGFSPDTRAIIIDRAVYACERCGERHSDMAAHHRRPRALGGSKRPETNQPANGVWLCGACHRHVESYRSQAFDEGFLVRQSQTPCEVPVLRRGVWVLLSDDGGIHKEEAA